MNPVSSAETGAVKAAVSAEPESLADSSKEIRMVPQGQVNCVLQGPQNEAIPIAGDTIGITFDWVVSAQHILVLYPDATRYGLRGRKQGRSSNQNSR